MGRPSIYTEAIADRICEELASGKSLLSICKDESFPCESAVRAWALDNREGFYAKYARARDIGIEVMADELVEIADTKDVMGRYDNVERSKLRVDTRKWLLSKIVPKKYGDRTVLAGDEAAPLKVVFERIAPKSHIDESSKVS